LYDYYYYSPIVFKDFLYIFECKTRDDTEEGYCTLYKYSHDDYTTPISTTSVLNDEFNPSWVYLKYKDPEFENLVYLIVLDVASHKTYLIRFDLATNQLKESIKLLNLRVPPMTYGMKNGKIYLVSQSLHQVNAINAHNFSDIKIIDLDSFEDNKK